MSRTKIWKKALGWAVPSSDVLEVDLPATRDILDFQLQEMYPTIWFIADPESPLESVRFHIIGTDNPMPEADLSYVGTWQHNGFVWHVFEEVG